MPPVPPLLLRSLICIHLQCDYKTQPNPTLPNQSYLQLAMFQSHAGVSENQIVKINVKAQMQIEISNFTLILAIDIISAFWTIFCNRDFSWKYPGDTYLLFIVSFTMDGYVKCTINFRTMNVCKYISFM